MLFSQILFDVCLSRAPLAFCQGRLYLHEKSLKCISHILNGCDICWHSKKKMANKKYNSLYWNCNCECYSHTDEGDDNMMMTITECV